MQADPVHGISTLRQDILQVDPAGFEALALRIFRYQADRNPLYAQWLELLGRDPASIHLLEEIPFLPIRFFKNYNIQSGEWLPQQVFSSSGTTGAQTSKHFLRDRDWYLHNAERGFRSAYGPVEEYAWLALLPAYLERPGSSLIAMADHFIRRSAYRESGFFLYDHADLLATLQRCREKEIPVVLLGVSFALLDLAESRDPSLDHHLFRHCIVMETGGMKGRRKELTREALHRKLRKAFGLHSIHSEYGMTELLSQAYAQKEGRFEPSPTLRVLPRDISDPFSRPDRGRTAALDIIDLANVDTLSFIATDDLGRVYADGSFEVLGRLDASDMRGCNLLVL